MVPVPLVPTCLGSLEKGRLFDAFRASCKRLKSVHEAALAEM
jgi:hypothetical protein